METRMDQAGAETHDEPDEAQKKQEQEERERIGLIMKEIFAAAAPDENRSKAEKQAAIKQRAAEIERDTDLALLIKYALTTKIVRDRTPVREVVFQPPASFASRFRTLLGFRERKKPNGYAAVRPKESNGSAPRAEQLPLDEIIPILVTEKEERAKRKPLGSGQS